MSRSLKKTIKMEKKIRPASIFITLCLLAICGTALLMGIKIIITHWDAIMKILTSASVYTGVISISIFLTVILMMNKNPVLSDKKIGKIIVLSSLALFFLNSFVLFNKFGLLPLWLIILGGIFFLILIYFAYRYLENNNDKNLPILIGLFLLIAFMYYLDIFIFAWDRPYLSGAATLFLTGKYINSLFPVKTKKRRI